MAEEASVTVNGIDITVSFNYSPPSPGRKEGGMQMEPDDPEHFEVLEIKSTADLFDLFDTDEVIEMIKCNS